jgi:hypothetical protein
LTKQKYDDVWKTNHRAIDSILDRTASTAFDPNQDLENKFLLQALVDSPEDFHQQYVHHPEQYQSLTLISLRRFTFSLTTQLIYGFRCPGKSDHRLQGAFQVWVTKLFR